MKLKIILISVLIVITFAMVIAANSELEKVGSDWDNVGQFKKDGTTSKYGKYEIRNSVLGLKWFQLSKVADIELVNNSDYCSDCYAEIPITLYNDGILIDDVIFKTLQNDGSWIEQPIRNYKISYPGQVKKYKTVCNDDTTPNGTIIKNCEDVENGTVLGRIQYEEGEVVEAGTYYVRIDGQKKPSRIVDWVIDSNGIMTDEWAIWGNISDGDDAEVILNSPANASEYLKYNILFNATANISTGEKITNMSLWTNSTGNWSMENISQIYPTNLENQYRLDETSGAVIDYSDNVSNGTNQGATTAESGIIGTSYNFDASAGTHGDYLEIPQVNLDNFTINMWLNPDGNWGSNSDHFCSLKEGSGATGDRIYYSNGVSFQIDDAITGSGYTLANHIGSWKMYTFRRNGTNIEIFVNGTSVDNTTVTANTFSITSFAGKINAGTAVAAYDGKLDEITIFNEAISNSEIVSLYNSGSAQYPLVSEKTKTWNLTINNTINWNVQACDSDGDCGFAENNYTVSMDSSKPQISVESPIGTLNYNSIGNNETLNVTFTDINLESCWYNYNGTNITIEGCLTGVKNSTEFLLEAYDYNMTIYSNDTIGNNNSTFIEWSYNLTEISQTYPSNSVESATETYTATLDYNSSFFNIINGILTLNGTEYIGTRSGSGNNATFSADAIIPAITTETNFTAYWTIGLTDADSTTSYNLTSHNVTASIINLSLCDATNNVPFWNFTILNESNGAQINSTFEATFSVKQSGSTTTNEFSFSNTTEDASEFDFCISPGTESYTIATNIKITKTGYVDKYYNYEEVVVTNSTREDNLYMLVNADSTSFIIHVVDVSGTDIDEAEVRVQRYYPGEGKWKTTEIVTTNYVGETIGHLLSEDSDYRFLVYQDGVSIYNSTATKISCQVSPCTVTLVIPVEALTGYEITQDLDSTLTFSDTTNVFTYTYTDSSGLFSQARLYVVKAWPSNATLIIPCNTTKYTAAGVITCDITGQTNGTYQASAYITRDSDEFLDRRESGVIGTNIYNVMGDDGVLWGMFVFIGIVMIGVARPSLGIIFGAGGVIFLSLLGIINVGAISIVAISAIAVVLLVRIGRE